MKKKKLSKKTKRNIAIGSIVLVVLLLLGWFLIPKAPIAETALPSGPQTGGSSGGSPAPEDTGEDDGVPFFDFPDIDWTGWIPDFDFPWGNDDTPADDPYAPTPDLTPEEEEDDGWFDFDIPSFSFPTISESTLEPNGGPCKSDDECQSGFCDLSTYAIGNCIDPMITERPYDCEGYATRAGYKYYYSGLIPRGASCQTYAETECITSRLVTSHVPADGCCVWNC